MKITEFEKICLKFSSLKIKKLSRSKPVIVFGTGSFGKLLSEILIRKNYNFIGFVETKPKVKIINGHEVFSWGSLKISKKTQVLIGIFNRNTPLDIIEKQVIDHEFLNYFFPWDIYQIFHKELQGRSYWLSLYSDITESVANIKKVIRILSDDKSKSCLLNILAFRLGLNNSYASFSHNESQYFNDLTLLPLSKEKKINYVDGGAFNGDTLLALKSHIGVNNCWLFEPDKENYKLLIKNLKNIDNDCNITTMPCGLSDSYQNYSFNINGEASTITKNGSQTIVVGTLDQFLLNNNVDFIKLDVEGFDKEAIMGAKNLITKSRPVIAMSLYHLPKDPWEIPLLLNKYCKNYNFYIRQHLFNSFESVFYAIPN